MCMYVCVHAVRPKCNGFMAPAFAVHRKTALVMLRAVGLCFRAHPVTSAPGASEHMSTRTVAAELYYLNHIRSQAASALGSQGRCSEPSAALCISGVQVLLGLVMGMVKSVSLIGGLRDMLSALQQMFTVADGLAAICGQFGAGEHTLGAGDQ